MDLGIIDTHLHLWDLDTLPYSWLMPGAPQREVMFNTSAFRGNYLPDDFRQDTTGQVIGSVFVQSECDDWLGEAQWAQEQGDRTGIPDVIIADGNPAMADFETYLDTISVCNRVRGIRSRVFWHDTPEMRVAPLAWEAMLQDPAYRRGVQALANRGLILEVGCYVHQLPELARLVADYPGMQFILPHMGRPLAGEFTHWRQGIKMMAQYPNVAVKMSGLGQVNKNYDPARIGPVIYQAIEAFGIDRVFYGSDMPVEKFFCPFDMQLSGLSEVFKHATPAERDAVFRTNAQRVYQFQEEQPRRINDARSANYALPAPPTKGEI